MIREDFVHKFASQVSTGLVSSKKSINWLGHPAHGLSLGFVFLLAYRCIKNKIGNKLLSSF